MTSPRLGCSRPVSAEPRGWPGTDAVPGHPEPSRPWTPSNSGGRRGGLWDHLRVMAVTTRSATQHPVLPPGRLLEPLRLRVAAPSLFAALSGIAFVILRPGVNDLWAARARASAAKHGVGLTYWFSWFGGGTTPGNYSVLTPYTSALIGTEVLGAVSALAVTVLATIAVRGTAYPVAGAWVAAVSAALNLWSGRVPFLFGSALAVGAVIAIQHQRRLPAMGLTLVSILASPVS